MLIPRPLSPGDHVALVCPSSPLAPGHLDAAVEAVEAMGLSCRVYPSCRGEAGLPYLADDDARRAGDLMDAFLCPDIRGILCARGGYGAHRLLPLLDFAAIAQNPKVFAGYSDITALHTALGRCCGFVTYHTPMPGSSTFSQADPFTLDAFRAALFGGLRGKLALPPQARPVPLFPGRARGRLTGGNLTLLADSLGTPWEVDTRGCLLLLEDVDEPLYRVDAMLTALRNAGKLRQCAGVILGGWTLCKGEGRLEEIFRQLLPPDKPTLADVPFGHVLPTVSLPLGVMAELDAGAGTLELLP